MSWPVFSSSEWHNVPPSRWVGLGLLLIGCALGALILMVVTEEVYIPNSSILPISIAGVLIITGLTLMKQQKENER